MTKDWLIAALVRIYPAAWRREYGEELTGILSGRPLASRVIADVAWNGLWQRGRAAEPSTILGFAAMLIILARFVLVGATYGHDGTALLQPSSIRFPTVTVTFLSSEYYAYLLLGCGCWTYLRYGGTAKQSGMAAMRMSLIAGMPIIVGALLMMAGLLGVSVSPRLHPPSAWSILVVPLARLPGAWMWGALGGQLGKWIARRALTPAGLSE
jgi:hypothetical protein